MIYNCSKTRNSKSDVIARRRRGSVRLVHDEEDNEASALLFEFCDSKAQTIHRLPPNELVFGSFRLLVSALPRR